MKKECNKILLVNPSGSYGVYKKSKVIAINSPHLALATLGATLLENKCNVHILDLVTEEYGYKIFEDKLIQFKPDYVGITFATPTFHEAVALGDIAKKYNKNITLICGGPHASAIPEETLKESPFDIVVIGEGDYTIVEIIQENELCDIKGIYYKKDQKIFKNQPRELIENLDDLPYPAWDLFDLKKYKNTKSMTRKNPTGYMETSRSCPHSCTFCNKKVFGRGFRAKSPERVLAEIKYLLKIGFKEIHFQDDAFATNLERAKKICDLIIENNLKFPWVFASGIRADSIDEELLIKAKKSGCYRIQFGVESASQKLLNNVNKGETIEQIKEAIKLSKKIGLEVATFFMLGLPGETEETMKQTIDLAVKMDTDYSRVSMLMPLPGTSLFEEWDKKGYIKSKNWSKYQFHSDMSTIYTHPDIDMKLMKKYYNLFYKKFYLRPSYLMKRTLKSIFERHFFADLGYFLKEYVFR